MLLVTIKQKTSKQPVRKYNRVLLKISGEVLGLNGVGLDIARVDEVAHSIRKIKESTGVQLVVVVGAGNLFRGRYTEGTAVDRATADYIGMLGTVMNAIALQEAMERCGNNTRVMSAIPINNLCEPYVRRRAVRHLEKGRTVILGGGTGNPFCTTDFAAALRARELGCEAVLKASNIDGICDKDPRKHADACLYDQITYQWALEKQLKVMDATAFALCQESHIPIVVFNFDKPENITKIIRGERIGTLVSHT